MRSPFQYSPDISSRSQVPERAPKQSPGSPPAASVSAPEAVVLGSWGGLGGSWAALGRSWRFLASFWPLPAPLGPLRGRPGWPWPPPWTDSDGSWAAPGQVSAPPDRLFERSWRHRTLVWPTDRKSSTVQRFREFCGAPGVFVGAPGKLSAAHGALLAGLRELRASLGPAGAAPGVAWCL